jgi:hypothetical protein
MFDKFKKTLGLTKPEVKPAVKPKKVTKTDKEIATEKGEPYVAILSMELAEGDIDQGAFELDWNEKFIANLVRAGYQGQPNEPDHEIVDRWFQNVCRNVVMETYEQFQADPEVRFTRERDLGDGYTEVK